MSDYYLFYDYSGEETLKKTLSPLNDTSLLNDTLESCTLMTKMEEGFEFQCVEYNPYFASLTLTLIYLPSVNVIAALYGSRLAGTLFFFFGPLIALLGILMLMLTLIVELGQTMFILSLILLFLGSGMLPLGLIYVGHLTPGYLFSLARENIAHSIFLPLLMAFSPLILLIIKLFAVFKKTSKLIQTQSKVVSRGEALLEAAPQFILQLYIVLLSASSLPSWGQWVSIISSILSLPKPILEQYDNARHKETEKKSIINTLFKITIFLPAALFKLLVISITGVFLKEYTVVMYVFGSLILLFVGWLCIAKSSKEATACASLSWLTITNLGTNNHAAIARTISTIYWTIINTLILIVILIICNTNPRLVSISLIFSGNDVVWSWLLLVQNLSMLNILLITTICLGWIPLVLDVIFAMFKYWRSKNEEDQNNEDNGFWRGAILLEGFSYLNTDWLRNLQTQLAKLWNK